MIESNPPHKILCRYTNRTSQFQIIRISNIPHWFFERTVIPKGHILFTTFREAKLEIHTGTMIGSILSDIIPCAQSAQTQHGSTKQPQNPYGHGDFTIDGLFSTPYPRIQELSIFEAALGERPPPKEIRSIQTRIQGDRR